MAEASTAAAPAKAQRHGLSVGAGRTSSPREEGTSSDIPSPLACDSGGVAINAANTGDFTFQETGAFDEKANV